MFNGACKKINLIFLWLLKMKSCFIKNEGVMNKNIVIYQARSGKIEFRGDFKKDTIWGSLRNYRKNQLLQKLQQLLQTERYIKWITTT